MVSPNSNGGDGRHIPLSVFTDRSQMLVSKAEGEVIPVLLSDVGIPYVVNADGSLTFSPPAVEISDRLFVTDNSVEGISGWSFDVTAGEPIGDTIVVNDGPEDAAVKLAVGVYFVTANVTVRKPSSTSTDAIGTVTLNTNAFNAGSTTSAEVAYVGDFRSGQTSEIKVAVSSIVFVSQENVDDGAYLYVSGGQLGGTLQVSDRSLQVVRLADYPSA